MIPISSNDQQIHYLSLPRCSWGSKHSFPKALFLLDDAELIKLKCVTMQIGCVCPFLHGVHSYSPFFHLLCSKLQQHQHYVNHIVLLLYELYLAERIFINKHTCISKQASSVFIHHLCTLPTHYVTALRLKKKSSVAHTGEASFSCYSISFWGIDTDVHLQQGNEVSLLIIWYQYTPCIAGYLFIVITKD